MAQNLNKVMIIGRLGRDPEMRYTSSGKAVTNFSLAVSGRGEDTEWFNVEAWEKTAEIINQYCHKGDKLFVEGRLKTETWEKDGVKHYKTKVVATGFEFLTPKGNGSSESEPVEDEGVTIPF